MMYYLCGKLLTDEPLETATLMACQGTGDVRPVIAAAAEDENGQDKREGLLLRWTLDVRNRWDFARRLWDGSSEHTVLNLLFKRIHEGPLNSLLSRFLEMCLYWPKINVAQRKGERLAAYATIQTKSSEKASVGGT